MVLYQAFTQEHRIRYLASPCSSAVLCQVCCLLLTFLLPLFAAYFTGGFYYKELTYIEQPNATFLQQYDIIIDSFSTMRLASSSLALGSYFGSNFAPSYLKTGIPRDMNSDGVADQQTISMTAILPSSISASTVTIWLIYQYKLKQYPLVDMQALAAIPLQAPVLLDTNTTLTIYGKLRFRQHQPVYDGQSDSTIQGSIINFGSYSIVPSFEDIMNQYYSRNYYTTFDPQYVQWSSQSATDSSTLLTVNVIVNNDPQVIIYVPSFWKEFRWTWIQYFTALLPFYYIANKIKEFSFSNHLVRSFPKLSP